MDERKKLEPVANAIEKKKSMGERLKETFIQEDIKEVGRHVTNDVIVPAIKKGFYETITGGLGMLLGVDQKKSSASVPAAHVSYSSFYDRRNEVVKEPLRAKTSYSVKDMIFDTQEGAQRTLDSMRDVISVYRSVSVSDFLELCGCEKYIEHTDGAYGWTNLDGCRVVRTSEGYQIDLPRPKPLD